MKEITGFAKLAVIVLLVSFGIFNMFRNQDMIHQLINLLGVSGLVFAFVYNSNKKTTNEK